MPPSDLRSHSTLNIEHRRRAERTTEHRQQRSPHAEEKMSEDDDDLPLSQMVKRRRASLEPSSHEEDPSPEAQETSTQPKQPEGLSEPDAGNVRNKKEETANTAKAAGVVTAQQEPVDGKDEKEQATSVALSLDTAEKMTQSPEPKAPNHPQASVNQELSQPLTEDRTETSISSSGLENKSPPNATTADITPVPVPISVAKDSQLPDVATNLVPAPVESVPAAISEPRQQDMLVEKIAVETTPVSTSVAPPPQENKDAVDEDKLKVVNPLPPTTEAVVETKPVEVEQPTKIAESKGKDAVMSSDSSTTQPNRDAPQIVLDKATIKDEVNNPDTAATEPSRSETIAAPKSTVATSTTSSKDQASSRIQEESSAPLHTPPREPAWDEIGEVFPMALKRKIRATSLSRKRTKRKIKIKISSLKTAPMTADTEQLPKKPVPVASLGPGADTGNDHGFELDYGWSEPTNYEREVQDALAFFAETHEDQDPLFVQFESEKKQRRAQDRLAKLDEGANATKQEIERVISAQLKEKLESSRKTFERLRSKAQLDEKKDLDRLANLYKEKTASNQAKINQSVTDMTSHHTQQLQQAAVDHQRQAQQRGIPEQMSTAEWALQSQRLQARNQKKLEELNLKGEDVKQKCNLEYERAVEKRRKFHADRKKDLEENMQRMVRTLRVGFEQQRHKYMGRYIEAYKKERKEILADIKAQEKPESHSTPTKSNVSSKDDEKSGKDLLMPAPLQLHGIPLTEKCDESELPNAASRLKLRKNVLNSAPKQLSVEIHNEGLWISLRGDSRESKHQGDSSTKDKKNVQEGIVEFVAWGMEARSILQSITCGRIPLEMETGRFDFGEELASTGHVRCVLTDLRTSDGAAAAQRTVAVKEQEENIIRYLEAKVAKLNQAVTQAEERGAHILTNEKECAATLEQATKQADKARRDLDKIRTKFKPFLGPDDIPVANMNSSDRQKLMQGILRYKSNLEGTVTLEKDAQAKFVLAKELAQKVHSEIKQAQRAASAVSGTLRKKKALVQEGKTGQHKTRLRLSDAAEAERAATRVRDTIAAFRKVSDVRREQHNQRRSSSASTTWLHGLPGLSGPLKKSLWYKLLRRRPQVTLRPNVEFEVEALVKSLIKTDSKKSTSSTTPRGEDALRAEQLFLLSAYPEVGSDVLPSIPLQHAEPWAEPGSRVDLNVYKEKRGPSLLPRIPAFPLLQQNHCELISSLGCQLESVVRPSHFGGLTKTLSAVSQVISYAGSAPPKPSDVATDPHDPLFISEADMKLGYEFALKPAGRPSSQGRRKPPTKDDTDSIAPQNSKKTTDAPVPSSRASPSLVPPSRGRSATKTAKPKRSRSKSSAGGSPRAKSKKSAVSQVDPRTDPRYLQQQQPPPPGASPLSARPVFSPQGLPQAPPPQQTSGQYGQRLMNPAQSTQQHGMSSMQAQQLQQMGSTQQLMTQQQAFGSPQQQQQSLRHQQERQLAQMRLMQQHQQQQQQSGYPPQGNPSQMHFFSQIPQPPGTSQQSFSASQPAMHQPTMQLPVGHVRQSSSSSQSRQNKQGNEDNQHDPLFMLKDNRHSS